ncbi:hypothetical protein [Methylobacterium nigriterrae]|uniref:hypothetical protein n=1 Tax=Methylobacterium nigriterrae TaxID=3127512 RepID=UPI0030137084
MSLHAELDGERRLEAVEDAVLTDFLPNGVARLVPQELMSALIRKRGMLQPQFGGTSRRMIEQARRFSAPWRIIELEEAFRIEDAASAPLAYVYFSDDTERRAVTGYMSREEAQRIAANIAALPDLRAALREKDEAA